MKLLEFLATCERELTPMQVREELARKKYGVKLAVMVIDSVGFSRTTKAFGIVHFLSKMAAAREIITGVLDDSAAKAYSYHADNCIAYFPSSGEAVVAAAKLQYQMLHSGIALNDQEPYGLSIGIGYGELLYAESMEGYFGDEMNLASKLGEDIGGRDDILLTKSAFDDVKIESNQVFEERHVSVSGVDMHYYAMAWRR